MLAGRALYGTPLRINSASLRMRRRNSKIELLRKIIHELRVHQIELETQNPEQALMF
jgi:hypothetical protein